MQESRQKLATKTFIITLTAALTVAAIWSVFYFIYLVRLVVLDLVVALVIAAALYPLMSYMEKKGVRKIAAAVISILVVLLVALGIIAAVAAPLVSQGQKLITNAPQILDQVTHNTRITALNDKYHLVDNLNNVQHQLLSTISGQGGSALVVLGRIVGGISSVIFILIFVFFILVDGPEAWQRLLHYLPEENRNKIDATGRKMMRAISGYVSGNLFISLIAGTVTLITLLIFRVPYAFPLAALVALFDLIPLIGATLGTIVVGLVTLSKGVVVAIIVVILLVIYQFTENHFIQPVVYSRYVRLSALLIIVATLVGAELAGVIGVLLAIPAAAIIQIAINDLFFGKITAE